MTWRSRDGWNWKQTQGHKIKGNITTCSGRQECLDVEVEQQEGEQQMNQAGKTVKEKMYSFPILLSIHSVFWCLCCLAFVWPLSICGAVPRCYLIQEPDCSSLPLSVGFHIRCLRRFLSVSPYVLPPWASVSDIWHRLHHTYVQVGLPFVCLLFFIFCGQFSMGGRMERLPCEVRLQCLGHFSFKKSKRWHDRHL